MHFHCPKLLAIAVTPKQEKAVKSLRFSYHNLQFPFLSSRKAAMLTHCHELLEESYVVQSNDKLI